MTAPTKGEEVVGISHPPNNVIVVDLGKKKRKQVKLLRQGAGKLMDDVNHVLDELRANGKISGPAQPVVLVVSERRKTTPLLWF